MSKELAQTISRTELKFPSRYNVVFNNDDLTPMDFVIQLLIEVFNKSLDQATAITMSIHTEGKGVAGTYNHELAEQKQGEAQLLSRHNGYPLKITLEKM